MQFWTCSVAVMIAFACHMLGAGLGTFFAAAVALILLSKTMSDSTLQLTRYVGQQMAGSLNVALSNLPELIIIFVAIKANMIDLVHGGIVGSIVGNLMLVMGTSIYFGCRKNGTMSFNPDTATMFVNQFVLTVSTLFLPSMFAPRIPDNREVHLSYLLAAMLIGSYIYFHVLSHRDPRFKQIHEQRTSLNHQWSKRRAITVLVTSAIGAFMMSQFLVDEVQLVGHAIGFSTAFLGFIILPFLGNLASNTSAVVAARRNLGELSLSISVGAASQVAMIVAPAAVLFGAVTGHTMTLNFVGLPLNLLVISFVAAYVVLRDNRWNINEGVMLIAIYIAICLAFAFSQ